MPQHEIFLIYIPNHCCSSDWTMRFIVPLGKSKWNLLLHLEPCHRHVVFVKCGLKLKPQHRDLSPDRNKGWRIGRKGGREGGCRRARATAFPGERKPSWLPAQGSPFTRTPSTTRTPPVQGSLLAQGRVRHSPQDCDGPSSLKPRRAAALERPAPLRFPQRAHAMPRQFL
jgi:hypothetical protein